MHDGRTTKHIQLDPSPTKAKPKKIIIVLRFTRLLEAYTNTWQSTMIRMFMICSTPHIYSNVENAIVRSKVKYEGIGHVDLV